MIKVFKFIFQFSRTNGRTSGKIYFTKKRTTQKALPLSLKPFGNPGSPPLVLGPTSQQVPGTGILPVPLRPSMPHPVFTCPSAINWDASFGSGGACRITNSGPETF